MKMPQAREALREAIRGWLRNYPTHTWDDVERAACQLGAAARADAERDPPWWERTPADPRSFAEWQASERAQERDETSRPCVVCGQSPGACCWCQEVGS